MLLFNAVRRGHLNLNYGESHAYFTIQLQKIGLQRVLTVRRSKLSN